MVFPYKRRGGLCVSLRFGVFRVRPVFPGGGGLVGNKKKPRRLAGLVVGCGYYSISFMCSIS